MDINSKGGFLREPTGSLNKHKENENENEKLNIIKVDISMVNVLVDGKVVFKR